MNATFTKVLGVFDGLIAATAKMVDAVRSHAFFRAFITSLILAIAAGAAASVHILKTE